MGGKYRKNKNEEMTLRRRSRPQQRGAPHGGVGGVERGGCGGGGAAAGFVGAALAGGGTGELGSGAAGHCVYVAGEPALHACGVPAAS